jgi:hypothetical protein
LLLQLVVSLLQAVEEAEQLRQLDPSISFHRAMVGRREGPDGKQYWVVLLAPSLDTQDMSGASVRTTSAALRSSGERPGHVPC